MFLRRLSALTLVLLACGATTTYATTSLAKPSTLIAEQSTNQKRPDREGQRMFQQLNLTPEQAQQMRQLQSKFKTQIEPRQQALRKAQQEMRELRSNNSSADQISAKTSQIQSLRQELNQIKAQHLQEVRAILTPEQIQKFDEMIKNRPDKSNRNNRLRGQ